MRLIITDGPSGGSCDSTATDCGWDTTLTGEVEDYEITIEAEEILEESPCNDLVSAWCDAGAFDWQATSWEGGIDGPVVTDGSTVDVAWLGDVTGITSERGALDIWLDEDGVMNVWLGDTIIDGTPGTHGNDDGLTNVVNLQEGMTPTFTFDVYEPNPGGSAGGFINAWCDLNSDEDYNDANEQLLSDAATGALDFGVNSIVMPSGVTIPMGAGPRECTFVITEAALGACEATYSSGLTEAEAGEIESYELEVLAGGPGGIPEFSTWALMLALIVVISGFAVMRRRRGI
jgi:hypothetical protein